MNQTTESLITVPGECLEKADQTTRGGDGTYTKFGHIFASLTGRVQVKNRKDDSGTSVLEYQEVSVEPCHKPPKKAPEVGSIVTCKVTNIGTMHCKCTIHCIGDHVLNHPFKGMIRKEDIREIEKGTVEIWKCFRPGDIVLARVIGVGEGGSFLLSTAEDELGVVVAYSASFKDTPMIPVNWTQMRCPRSYTKELRKVAKIDFGQSDTNNQS